MNQYGTSRSRQDNLLTAIDAAQRYARSKLAAGCAENEVNVAHNLPLLLDPARLGRLAESCRPAGADAIE